MPTLDRAGVKLHYETYGAGPVILLSHGYSATTEMWRGQIEALSRDHQLILWDMRGHGRSDYPADPAEYSEDKTVADMAALLDAAGADRAIVGGLSLGGYMSLAFHRAHPERVRALLIIDTGPGFKNEEAREKWNRRCEEFARHFEAEGLGYLRSLSKEMTMSSHRSADGLVRAARGMLIQRDARVIQSLAGIQVPALVIVGADDTPFLAAADYMAAKIPNAMKVVIPGAGHASNIDQPGEFNRAVVRFLADQAFTRV
ncbi:MAG: alpha/beta hydrolase [Acidobacteriia bacterium]|nr:alpha/beta hydrolase [Terriglobia bacterium]